MNPVAPLRFHFLPDPVHRVPVPVSVWGVDDIVQSIPAPIGHRRLAPASCADVRPSRTAVEALGLLTLRLSVSNQPGIFRSESRSSLQLASALLKVFAWGKKTRIGYYPSMALHVADMLGISRPAFRSERSWVGGRTPREALLIPPAGSDISRLMGDLGEFLHANADRDIRELSDGLAYQFLVIHPLSDGNGRVLRAMLVALASARISSYPLFLAWCQIFIARKLVSSWEIMRAIGALPENSVSLESSWLRSATMIEKGVVDLCNGGMDERVINALLALGWISTDALRELYPVCGRSLAGKLLLQAKDMLYLNERGSYTCPMLDAAIENALSNWKTEIEQMEN